ncbi:Hypothetical predicted protein [Octopus vulgaris]|uniref:Reverse transcriptase domain-containing protein n=1 Tax=Octopus vulgaris TaxID=6645 RepID=A0AA36B7V0_OCTVU|nr:Hypothetical predicted protein [Octopus vulgaris]
MSTTLGTTKRKDKDWISGRTIEIAEKAKQARCNQSDTFRQLRREAAHSARADRNKFWRTVAEDMECAASTGDSRKLYSLLRSSTKTGWSGNETILDQNGDLITNLTERIIRWRDHFANLLNHDHQPPLSAPAIDATPTLYDCQTAPPTLEEVLAVIRKLNNNKAAGEDNIPAEILKHSANILGARDSPSYHPGLGYGNPSPRLERSTLVPFFKKGDKRCCNNYRGISLIDVSAKIFASILLRRFQSERDSRTRPNQCSFRPNRGCTDQIFTLRRILEHRWCFRQKTVICFVDFAAAFDSINRDTLWKVTQQMVSHLNFSILSKLITAQQDPAEFPGIIVGHNFSVKDLDYADDIAILGETFADVQFAINELQRVASQIERTLQLSGLGCHSCSIVVFYLLLPHTGFAHMILEYVEYT